MGLDKVSRMRGIPVKWSDLFAYLDKRVNFHSKDPKDPEGNDPYNVVWTCHNNFQFTEEFCVTHNISFATLVLPHIRSQHCDCEIIFNLQQLNTEEEIK